MAFVSSFLFFCKIYRFVQSDFIFLHTEIEDYEIEIIFSTIWHESVVYVDVQDAMQNSDIQEIDTEIRICTTHTIHAN